MPATKYDHHPHEGVQVPEFSPSERRVLEREYAEKEAFLRDDPRLASVTPFQFYRAVFPEGSFELSADRDDSLERRPNGLLSILVDADARGRSYNRILFDDFEALDEALGKDFVVCSPIGFSGRRRLSKLAYQFFGMAIDLDDVDVHCIQDLLFQMDEKIIPPASYIVQSGTGLHVYYLYEVPIPAYPRYFESLNNLKDALTDLIWNAYTSRSKTRQHQSIFQAYRIPGSNSKLGAGFPVTAWKFRDGERILIRTLNEYVDKKDQADLDDLHYTSLKEAAELYPEWYKRRIVDGRVAGDYIWTLDDKQKKRRKAWYDGWKTKIRRGAVDGNRYYCMGVLWNMGFKAQVDPEEILEYAESQLPWLNSLTTREGNAFTLDDVYAAQRYFDIKYIKLGFKGIKKMTGIDLGEPRKPKYPRKQLTMEQLETLTPEEIAALKDEWKAERRRWSLEDANDQKKKMKERGIPFRHPEGRPPGKSALKIRVVEWREEHPEGTPSECCRDTGISRATVYRHWDAAEEVGRERKLSEQAKRISAYAEAIMDLPNYEEARKRIEKRKGKKKASRRND